MWYSLWKQVSDVFPHLRHVGDCSSQFLGHSETLDIERELTLIGSPWRDGGRERQFPVTIYYMIITDLAY